MVRLFCLHKNCPKKVGCLNELFKTLTGIEELNDDEVEHPGLYDDRPASSENPQHLGCI